MTIKNRLSAALVATLLLLSGTSVARAQQPGFVVIVNAANPTAELTREELSSIFLKRQLRWEHGLVISPVDHASDAAVRDVFSRAVHGRSATAIRAYWQQQVFSGREVPPLEKDAAEGVIRAVAENPGGIGYVSAGTRLPGGVKIVPIRDM